MAVKPLPTTSPACRKVKFSTKAAARREAKPAAGAYRRPGPMTAYPCVRCGSWHIGHTTPATRPCRRCGARISLRPAGDGHQAYDAGTETWHRCPRR